MNQYIVCETCRKIREQERYDAMLREIQDGKAMLYSKALDRYYDSPDIHTNTRWVGDEGGLSGFRGDRRRQSCRVPTRIEP